MLLLLWSVLAAEPVAVVELFTSEGCSSCPAADALLTEIAAEARVEGHSVFTLSFHVDYWDRLGWKDPYSDARWTSRQRGYSEQFGKGKRVYTPQVVVNGLHEVVGSDRPMVKGLIAGALAKGARAEIAGTATARSEEVWVQLEVSAKQGRVFIAVVEPERRSVVVRGENKGRELVHTNVVRALVVGGLEKTEGTLPVPEDVDLATAEVVVWVVDPVSNEVLGATRLPIEAG